MTAIVQGQSYNQPFLMIASFDHITPLMGANPVVLISKNGNAFTSPAGLVSETGLGWYVIPLIPGDTDTVGSLAFHITAVGGDDTDFIDEITPKPVIPPLPTNVIQTPTPTFAGWQANFVYGVMGITTADLPTNSEWLFWAYNTAIATVNYAFRLIAGPFYLQAVYNLAGSILINNAPDNPPSTLFSTVRAKWNLDSFAPGLVTSAADEGTSDSLVVPEWAKNLNISDLQQLKDPYGRAYLAIAQKYGTGPWGIS